jgi:hypothetical protein
MIYPYPYRLTLRLLTLALLYSLTAGCWIAYQNPPPCPQVRQSPVEARIFWSSPPSEQYSIVFTLYGGGGLELELIPWKQQCTWLSAEQADAFRDAVASIADAAPAPSPITGETLTVQLDENPLLLKDPTHFEPEALEAARLISCIGLNAFPSTARRAIISTTPELASRLGFPDVCGGNE